MRVTPSLDTLGSFEICEPPDDSFIESEPVIVFDGTNYVVAWSDEKYGPSNTYHPFVARVSPAGVVLDSGVRVSTSSVAEYRPNIADDGERSFVMWAGSSRGSYGRFVNRAGMPEGDVVTLATGTASGPDAAFGDSCYLVVWHTGAYPTLELYGSLMSRTGELIGSPIPIATGTECHRWADVIHAGENFLVVWQTGLNNEPSTIYGQFIGDDGSLIGSRFAICGNEPQQRWWAAVAASDSNYLVVWEQGASARDVWGNIDLPVTSIAEPPSGPGTSVPRAAFGHELKSGAVYDALGRRANGNLRPGAYFLLQHGRPAKFIVGPVR